MPGKASINSTFAPGQTAPASSWDDCPRPSEVASTVAPCPRPSDVASSFLEIFGIVTWILDLFNDAAAPVVLSSHVGDSGVTWALHPSYVSTMVVEAGGTLSGRTNNPGPGSAVAYISDVASSPSVDDYRVIFGLFAHSLDRNDAGVVARFNPATNDGVLLWYNRTAATPRLELYNLLTSTLLWASAQTLTVGIEYEVELRVEGGQARVFFEGVERTPAGGVTVATLTGRRVGPRFFQFTDSGPATGLHISRLRVEEIGAATDADVIVQDSLTGASGSLLSAHVGEVGATWSVVSGDNTRLSGGNSIYHGSTGATWQAASGVPPTINYYVEAQFQMRSAMIGQNDGANIFVRHNGGRRVSVFFSNINNRWELYGPDDLLKATSVLDVPTTSFWPTVRLSAVGRVYTVTINGVERISWTDSADSAAPGFVAVRFFNQTTPSTSNSKLHLGPIAAGSL